MAIERGGDRETVILMIHILIKGESFVVFLIQKTKFETERKTESMPMLFYIDYIFNLFIYPVGSGVTGLIQPQTNFACFFFKKRCESKYVSCSNN